MATGARLLPAVVMACMVCLSQPGCGSRPATYQVARSADGRCVCEVIEYQDSDGDFARLLDLRVELDGREVLSRSYMGNKRWGGTARSFVVGRAGAFYCLSVAGHPGYALAAADGTTGAVWFQSTDEPSRHIQTAFASDPSMPRLTDLNSMNAFVLTSYR